MKKNAFIRKWIFPVALSLLLTGCGGSQESQLQKPETVLPASTAAVTETEASTTESVPEGTLFLTVAEIRFSLVGESENIYAGTVDPQFITWKSDDESLIKAEDGVLTAVGVGSARVTASCRGQEVSCQATCLAATPEELSALGAAVLRSPKRIAPQVGDQVLSFYENAAMVGDSSTYSFMKYEAKEGRLGSPRCLCRGKLGINNLLTHNLQLYYQGKETPLEDVLAGVDPQKAFILLGTNDVMVNDPDKVLGELSELLSRVLAKNGDLEIYLQSVFPVASMHSAENASNERINIYNEKLQDFAEEKGFHYVPVAPYLQDHIPGFAAAYHQDPYHPSPDGVNAWIDALRVYAYIQQLKGE